MTPKPIATAIIAVLLAGCASKPPPQPVTIVQPVTIIEPVYRYETPYPLAHQERLPDVIAGLAAPMPEPEPTGTPTAPGRLRTSDGPATPKHDTSLTLAKLIQHLEQEGAPDQLGGIEAEYLATTEPGLHAYNLGPGADASMGNGEYNRVYMLTREQGRWTATHICQDRSNRIQVWEAPDTPPLLLCSAGLGNGRPSLYLDLYRGTSPLLRLDRIESYSLPDEAYGGLPVLRIDRYDNWFYQYDYRQARLKEQVDLVYVRDRAGWAVRSRKWQEDAAYHFARFDALLSRGESGMAVTSLASEPPEGLQAYLDENAPGFRPKRGDWAHPRWSDSFKALDVCDMHEGECTWFHFDFAPDGRISAISRKPGPPKS